MTRSLLEGGWSRESTVQIFAWKSIEYIAIFEEDQFQALSFVPIPATES